MARTVRKNLQLQAKQALACLSRLDLYLFAMDEMSAGRQPAVDVMKSVMVEGHEQLRKLWTALYNQL